MEKILLGRVVMEKNHRYLLKHTVLKIGKIGILYLSDILKKEQCQSLPEELTNVPPLSSGFLTNSPLPGPTRLQIPDKSPGGMGKLGID